MANGVFGTGGIGGFGSNGFLLVLLLFLLLASCCVDCRVKNFIFIIILAVIALGGCGRTFGLLGGANGAL